MTKPDYLFEVSWEVCNKVGGIHTVIASKALTLQKTLKDNYILIGPGIWQDIEGNAEFEEDNNLLLQWKQKARSEGLDFKIGRWKIPGKPIAILVNFSSFFEKKDKIFAEFWEKFRLDSISGGWDYIEPVIFGYASGKVIESYYRFFISSKDTILSQFHEWMTGSGILYLKERVPQIATAFTTHATVLGRAIAGNNLPLYSELNKLDANTLAKQFNIQAKQSLEKIAANEADVFTTVSELTNNECKQFLEKPVDVITPNGFEKNLLPDDKTWLTQRIIGRKKLKTITQAIINQPIPEDALFINISGRYEFKNKGIDLFIEALNRIEATTRTIVAFILVPAGHAGPRLEILERIHYENFDNPITSCYLTHYLFNKDTDPIIQRLFQSGLNNGTNQNIKVIFSPVYLNGEDGIINISYYNLLPAFDLTIYPSYYEPWGYTPLESIAFKIPTITTSLAGFSHWVKSLRDIENNS
ncbi:MAG TPA: alpha-glucan family phosphorylase, partial [Bacteroidales bacterium]|nr:alpha-glucan family phosphorylase [Bacteroidales bacterium]